MRAGPTPAPTTPPTARRPPPAAHHHPPELGIEEVEYFALRRRFDAYDKEGDGVMNGAELAQLLKDMGQVS